MVYLFVHGGPGLNSNPERYLLKPGFDKAGAEIHFWHEPSLKRGTSSSQVTFSDVCDSLVSNIEFLSSNAPITVIAHSFGAYVVSEVMHKVQPRIARLIQIAPAFNQDELDFNLLKVGMNNYRSGEEFEALNEYLGSYDFDAAFDEKRFKMLLLAASNEKYASSYWRDQADMLNYYQYLSCEEYGFGIENYKSIRESMPKSAPRAKIEVPTEIIYGAYDPYVKRADENELENTYQNLRIHLFENSSHYCHLEEKERFLTLAMQGNLRRQIQNNLIEIKAYGTYESL